MPTYLYVNFLKEPLRDLHLSLEDLLPLLPPSSPRFVQGIWLQVPVHHRHFYALRDQRFGGVSFPFQQDLLQVVGLWLGWLYQVVR